MGRSPICPSLFLFLFQPLRLALSLFLTSAVYTLSFCLPFLCFRLEHACPPTFPRLSLSSRSGTVFLSLGHSVQCICVRMCVVCLSPPLPPSLDLFVASTGVFIMIASTTPARRLAGWGPPSIVVQSPPRVTWGHPGSVSSPSLGSSLPVGEHPVLWFRGHREHCVASGIETLWGSSQRVRQAAAVTKPPQNPMA